MKFQKAIFIIFIAIGIYSCKNVIVKEGEKVFIKTVFRKRVEILDGARKRYFLSKLKNHNRHVLTKGDYTHLKLLMDQKEIQALPTFAGHNRKDTKLFTCLPQNAIEVKNIFGKYPRHSIVPNNFGSLHIMDSKTLFEGLEKTGKNEYVVITAHNEQGFIVLPDGNKASIKAINEVCTKRGIIPIFVSCNAAKYTQSSATNYTLNIKEAMDLSNILKANLDYGMDESKVDNLLLIFKQLKNRNNQAFYIKRLSLVAGSSAALYSRKKLKRP